MQTTIHLTKDDIKTQKCGLHFEIKVSNELVINFTPEAIEELVLDYNNFLEMKNEDLSTSD